MIVLPVSDETVIPPTVHLVWLGSPPPPWVLDSWAAWRTFARETGLTVRTWTDDDYAASLTARVPGTAALGPVGRCDFYRVEILALHGGLYMDSDTIPLRPLSDFTGDRPGWLGRGIEADLKANNAMMGFPPGHPFLAAVWERGVTALARGVVSTIAVIGPAAYRYTGPHKYGVESVSDIFPSYPDAVKREQVRLGRTFTYPELLTRFPAPVRVVHFNTNLWLDATSSLDIAHRTLLGATVKA